MFLLSTPSFFVGIDWASRAHDLCLLSEHKPRTLHTEHSPAGFARILSWLRQSGALPEDTAIALERPDHPLVDMLLEHGYAVFSINPKQADRFRDRHSPSGAKDDRRDAFVLADALRTDLHKFTPCPSLSPEAIALRHASRRHAALQEDLGRLTNRLWQHLQDLAPQLLTLSSGAHDPFFWDLLLARFGSGSPRSLRPRVTRILAQHRIRRVSPDAALALLSLPPLPIPPARHAALVADILALLPILAATHQQLSTARLELRRLTTAAGDDARIIDSLPGADLLVTATILAEAGPLLASPDAALLRARSGTAPVTRRSGTSLAVSMRRACQPRLRDAFFDMARTAVVHDPWAKHLFRTMRARGLGYHRALRGVADRLVVCLVALLRNRCLYDPSKRANCFPA